MESLPNFKSVPPNLNTRQKDTTNSSNFDKDIISRDSTVVSNNSTTITSNTKFNGQNMNQHEQDNHNSYSNGNITLKLDEYNNSIPNGTDNYQRLNKDTDSDNDLSPNFTSPHTLKHHLLSQNGIPDYKRNNDAVKHESISTGIRSTLGVHKRNISQLKKQLGEPIPLPYKVKEETTTFDHIPMRRQSIKYVSPIRKQTIDKSTSTPFQVDQSTLKPLTLERLEKKHNIITKRWKDLVIKDKIGVEKKLKQLRSWDEEDRLNSFTRKRHHSLPSQDSTSLHNLIKPSREQSVSNPERSSFNQFESLENVSDMSEFSVFKLQQEVETNSQKLDRILEVLEGKNKSKLGKHFKLGLISSISATNLLWTICIITLLICQFYVSYYL
ncbi:hypothetical protein MOUN0_O12530 [Monosporozyma unispora]|nr:hypothetical protein C6P44_000058 [Kazachstania unispora]